jgi:hypothetical protein
MCRNGGAITWCPETAQTTFTTSASARNNTEFIKRLTEEQNKKKNKQLVILERSILLSSFKVK